MRRHWIALAVTIPLVLGTSGLTVVALFSGTDQTASQMFQDESGTECVAHIEGAGPITSLAKDQLENARTIIQVGASMGVSRRGVVIALATALQESQLRNLPYGDRDSVGLFQQRPSSGWGSVAELTDPPTAARKFYSALLKVVGWRHMDLTYAAQSVQRSAFPLAYAKWEPLATRLTGASSVECSDTLGLDLPSGAVGNMLRVALAQQGDPYIWGATGPDAFDCSGLVIYAWAQAGYEVRVRTAAEMYKRSARIPAGEERPGDLLYAQFNTRVRGPGHVMIVLRPGWVVEAPSAGKTSKALRPVRAR
jgi:peptidoglycan DL-endopeptidase CwlO